MVPIIPLKPEGFAILAPEDHERLKKYSWRKLESNGKVYAVRRETVNGKRRTVRMHREVMNCPPEMEVHHWNLNSLDNRKSNLFVCDPIHHRMIHKSRTTTGESYSGA